MKAQRQTDIVDESLLNANEVIHRNYECSSLPPPPPPPLTSPSNPCWVCTAVPDVYQRSEGQQRGPSTAVAFLCLLGDGGPDSSAA